MTKVALVTGASGGIGSAAAMSLAQSGWLVAVCYNEAKAAAEGVVWNIKSAGYNAEAFHCNLADFESVQNVVHQIKEVYGSITLLVNNGGVADIGLFTELNDDRMSEILNINLIGAMRLTKLVLPDMIHNKYGNIINISSVWGEVGASCEVAYSTAKAGLIGFTKALAREEAPSGIRVNCVSCGLIDTKMNGELSDEDLQSVIDEIPAGRIGSPQDVAEVISFLADDKSQYINGQVIRVDGCWC